MLPQLVHLPPMAREERVHDRVTAPRKLIDMRKFRRITLELMACSVVARDAVVDLLAEQAEHRARLGHRVMRAQAPRQAKTVAAQLLLLLAVVESSKSAAQST